MGDGMDAIRPTIPATVQPVPAGKLCGVCGVIILNALDEIGKPCWDGVTQVHPHCSTRATKWSGGGKLKPLLPGADHPIRQDLMEIILRGCANEDRSRQVTVGPSELGGSCDRRLGMRLAGVPAVSEPDPWPAEVGTAIHARMDLFVGQQNRRLKRQRYLTEHRVQVAPFLRGTSDLFDTDTGTVIDWKSAGVSAYRRMRDEGAPVGYQRQIQLYGLGWSRAGFVVKQVALAVLPRAGLLKDMLFFVYLYDPTIGAGMVDRMVEVGQRVVELKARFPHRDFWSELPGAEDNCWYCPYFCRGTRVASEFGCPGATKE